MVLIDIDPISKIPKIFKTDLEDVSARVFSEIVDVQDFDIYKNIIIKVEVFFLALFRVFIQIQSFK